MGPFKIITLAKIDKTKICIRREENIVFVVSMNTFFEQM